MSTSQPSAAPLPPQDQDLKPGEKVPAGGWLGSQSVFDSESRDPKRTLGGVGVSMILHSIVFAALLVTFIKAQDAITQDQTRLKADQTALASIQDALKSFEPHQSDTIVFEPSLVGPKVVSHFTSGQDQIELADFAVSAGPWWRGTASWRGRVRNRLTRPRRGYVASRAKSRITAPSGF